jgi:hypothetical protein
MLPELPFLQDENSSGDCLQLLILTANAVMLLLLASVVY